TILDWYHAAQHLHDFAAVLYPEDEEARSAWAKEAKEILYERGGEALLEHLRAMALPPGVGGEEMRKLVGYFERNRHRTDYPTYRSRGWDIGSGPTEAGCKIIGERLKGSGMRWVEEGAAAVGALRALYVSGAKVWDGFWEQPQRRAA
ncbi:MAG: ISKra4 family transposase, partial [Gemmatales bacterium]|nr:ISKra4 family transposase [Gemmatales bacterium]MDW8387182.1 ISKra4 family transposase [Gemmatales bacterium]